ncbi:MAG: helix-turn-helix domain-containing protein [Firmicutes bacterium]|nr:helix-turn-helix domain-containing protein [Bacillota bacterium]
MENGKLSIGRQIAELRKAKGVTQETLAEAVGVSGQAVSKWESGGYPDIELLQPIADYFDVSIDRLFGRNVENYADLGANMAAYLGQYKNENERVVKVFELAWALEFAFFGKKDDWPQISDTYKQMHSGVMVDGGITSLRMSNDLRYFLAMPRPEDGWGKVLYYKDEYREMLSLLADEDTLKMLFFLYGRVTKPFTPKLPEKELGISHEKAVSILKSLEKYHLIYPSEIELDDEVKTVYNFNANASFVPFLIFLEELINKPNSWMYYQTGGSKPLL